MSALTTAAARLNGRTSWPVQGHEEDEMHVKMAAVMVAGMLAAGSAEAATRVVVRTPVLRVSTATVVVAARPGYGRLNVAVDPERARVYVDGRYVGRGDASLPLRAGRHSVRVKLSDGREALQTVHIERGRVTVARLDLNG